MKKSPFRPIIDVFKEDVRESESLKKLVAFFRKLISVAMTEKEQPKKWTYRESKPSEN